uniref:Cleavage and polyadenylation specificity factor subunit 2 n=1 Tax=Lygus hesperus TaxID=30085 RepID=A0A0A9YQ43_LYGHE
MKDQGLGIKVIPSEAGHMLGGTYWNILRETESIMYAVHFNHAGEHHINPGLVKAPNHPTLLITNSHNMTRAPLQPYSKRENIFVKIIRQTLHNGGNVLLPIPAAGRILEILTVLNEHWNKYNLAYPVFFLSPVSSPILELCKNYIEWGSAGVQDTFSQHRVNPFEFTTIKPISSLLHIRQI